MNLTTMEPDQLPQFRRWLGSVLKTGIVTVAFVKADGTLRKMRATLDSRLIPPQPVKEDTESKTRKVSADTLAVWSVDDGGWRSFRLDRVQSVMVSDGGGSDVLEQQAE